MPIIDRLAKEGLLFRNCFCTHSICTPSRAVIFKGKYSHFNGVSKFTALDQSRPIGRGATQSLKGLWGRG